VKVGSKLVYWLARNSFAVYFRLHGGIRAVGAENIPKTGGAIIASNHMTNLEAPALSVTMHRRLLAMAKEELWKNKIYGWVIGQIGAYPIKRGEGDTEAIRWCIAVLEAGNTLLVFPEGTRGDGETLLPIQRGAGMLAKKANVPVVPAGVVGTHVLQAKDGTNKKVRREVVVAYGKPFTWEEIATGSSEKENRELFAKELERRIVELCRANGLPLKTSS